MVCSAACSLAQDTAKTNAPVTDYGPFFSATIRAAANNVTMKGIVVTVGDDKRAYICYDEDMLRASIGWTGEWLRTGNYLKEIIHPKPPEVAGTPMFKTPSGLPGWVKANGLMDPRPLPQGPVPKDYAHYRGLYRDGDAVVLSYSVGGMDVLERPGFVKREGVGFFTRTFDVSKLEPEWGIVVAEANGEPIVAGTALAAVEGDRCVAVAVNGGAKTRLEYTAGKLVVRLLGDPGKTTALELAVWSGLTADLPKFIQANSGQANIPSLANVKKGGPARWKDPVMTRGTLGNSDAPYAVDTITEPVPNPWNTRTFFGGFDFFPDGRAAMCTFHGDVWIVSGLDESLNQLSWKRFASGMFQPLGVKVVDGQIYVTCRDGLVRLHDLNKDGEADFYENFNGDVVVTANYHEFAMDLQTDSQGNFYYFKGSPWEPDVKAPHQGTCLKVSKDGSKLEVFATGFRAPNGSGMGPGDVLTVSDNQGHWMPSSKLNLVKRGGFYGMTPAAHREMELIAGVDVLNANPSDPEVRAQKKIQGWNAGAPQPQSYDQPICWLPMNMDNSSGGQVWSTSPKWGPLANHMLFMSYGRGTVFEVMMEEVEGATQAAMVRIPFKLTSGAMRGRENPRDGQIYVSGLRGWQTEGIKEGGFYRIRHTGKPARMPVDFHVKTSGVAITFSEPLDEAAAKDVGNYTVEAWNYLYSGAYGSADYSPQNPGKKGRDKIEVKSASLSADRKTATLEMPVKPVMQMRIKFTLKSADGALVSHEIYNTIHKVPSQRAELK
jgi:hypothetical protein